MEIAIAIFLGLWLSGASFLAYRRLKREYKVVFDKQEEKEVESVVKDTVESLTSDCNAKTTAAVFLSVRDDAVHPSAP